MRLSLVFLYIYKLVFYTFDNNHNANNHKANNHHK